MTTTAVRVIDEAERLTVVRGLGLIGDIATPELDDLAHLARKLFEVPYAAVNIIEEDWQTAATESGMELRSCCRSDSICTHVVKSHDVLIVPDLRADIRFVKHPATCGSPSFRSYAGAPLELEQGALVGAFCVLDTVPRDFTTDQVGDLRHFASVASGLLRHHRDKIIMSLAEAGLRNAAMTDPLTGFYNRTALSEIVDPALEAALTSGKRLGALYLDMDGFKSINDRFGHPAGDEVLRQAAMRITDTLNTEDIVVRMGGDEFVVFRPGTSDILSLLSLAERLVEAFREPFDIGTTHVLAPLSAGVALAPDHADDRISLLNVVDAALYQAKASGRNCARIAASEKSGSHLRS